MKRNKVQARPRNAVVTREAILASARRAFARSGFDGAGLREIAAGAGITAVLVNRYFGSKEGLFAEVIAATMAEPVILTAENLKSSRLGETIAATLVNTTRTDETPLDDFLIMLHSTSSHRASKIGREQIEKGHQKTLASGLRGPFAPERAALVLAIVAGVQVMRQMIGLAALAKADPVTLINLLAPIFQQLVEDNPAAGLKKSVGTGGRRSAPKRQ